MDPLGSRANLAKSASIRSVRSLVKRYTASKEHLRLSPSLIQTPTQEGTRACALKQINKSLN